MSIRIRCYPPRCNGTAEDVFKDFKLTQRKADPTVLKAVNPYQIAVRRGMIVGPKTLPRLLTKDSATQPFFFIPAPLRIKRVHPKQSYVSHTDAKEAVSSSTLQYGWKRASEK